jgi:hypothetical protein
VRRGNGPTRSVCTRHPGRPRGRGDAAGVRRLARGARRQEGAVAFVRAQLALHRICEQVPLLDDWHWETFQWTLLDCEDDWGRHWFDYLRTHRERVQYFEEAAEDWFDLGADSNDWLATQKQPF